MVLKWNFFFRTKYCSVNSYIFQYRIFYVLIQINKEYRHITYLQLLLAKYKYVIVISAYMDTYTLWIRLTDKKSTAFPQRSTAVFGPVCALASRTTGPTTRDGVKCASRRSVHAGRQLPYGGAARVSNNQDARRRPRRALGHFTARTLPRKTLRRRCCQSSITPYAHTYMTRGASRPSTIFFRGNVSPPARRPPAAVSAAAAARRRFPPRCRSSCRGRRRRRACACVSLPPPQTSTRGHQLYRSDKPPGRCCCRAAVGASASADVLSAFALSLSLSAAPVAFLFFLSLRPRVNTWFRRGARPSHSRSFIIPVGTLI